MAQGRGAIEQRGNQRGGGYLLTAGPARGDGLVGQLEATMPAGMSRCIIIQVPCREKTVSPPSTPIPLPLLHIRRRPRLYIVPFSPPWVALIDNSPFLLLLCWLPPNYGC